ncbi:MAG: succinylglutamate desuccinylase/aspartoacylase family protein [Candidatus Paceibacterota bacterium]|jgi:succinylglutamate desuccinylase
MKYQKTIFIKKGQKPGKTLAVFAGVHGNEKVGVLALDKIIPKIEIEFGTVYFVYANPEAILANTRKIKKDLNRSCLPNNCGKSYEDNRARTLMRILDKADAFLDLHAFSDRKGSPFVIGEKDSYDLARKMDFQFVISGWDKFDIGSTDGYMRSLGKPAICLELGPNSKAKKYLPLAIKSVRQFLEYYGATKSRQQKEPRQRQIYSKLQKRVCKDSANFKFSKTYYTCALLKAGTIFATSGNLKYRAGRNSQILFPNQKAATGDEACLIAKLII